MTSSNPFLIHVQENVAVQQNGSQWFFDVGKSGVLKVDFLQTDADLSVEIRLMAEDAKCEVNCAYLSNKNNKLNIDIKVLHQAKNTCSEQHIKGIAADESSVCFNGLIEIPKDSQKCDGRQQHRGLLLSKTASISAVPQLEIWADDVVCAHGSAVGPLDKMQLFYLRTRGLSETEAKKMLVSSFLGDIMPEAFSEYIQQWMDANV